MSVVLELENNEWGDLSGSWLPTGMYVCRYVCMYVSMYVYAYVCICEINIYACMY